MLRAGLTGHSVSVTPKVLRRGARSCRRVRVLEGGKPLRVDLRFLLRQYRLQCRNPLFRSGNAIVGFLLVRRQFRFGLLLRLFDNLAPNGDKRMA